VEHREPDHLNKPGRVKLLQKILDDAKAHVDELERTTNECTPQVDKEKAHHLRDIYKVARLVENFRSGDLTAEATVYVAAGELLSPVSPSSPPCQNERSRTTSRRQSPREASEYLIEGLSPSETTSTVSNLQMHGRRSSVAKMSTGGSPKLASSLSDTHPQYAPDPAGRAPTRALNADVGYAQYTHQPMIEDQHPLFEAQFGYLPGRNFQSHSTGASNLRRSNSYNTNSINAQTAPYDNWGHPLPGNLMNGAVYPGFTGGPAPHPVSQTAPYHLPPLQQIQQQQAGQPGYSHQSQAGRMMEYMPSLPDSRGYTSMNTQGQGEGLLHENDGRNEKHESTSQ
jgi:hypothetical protein